MSAPEHIDVLVVGAGPAGLSAALAAAKAGARVVVLDEYARPGGQFYKQPFWPDNADPVVVEGRQLADSVREAGVDIRTETAVISRCGTHGLAVRGAGCINEITYSAIILATGAYDRVIAFPGWDLPGVVTAGGAQSLAKTSGAAFKGRVLLVGSGPFLLPVARTLLKAGNDLAGVFELGRPSSWLGHSGRLLLHPERMLEMLSYALFFARRKTRLRFGWRIVRAEGEGVLERVTLARCDNDGNLMPGTEMVHEANILCVGYGFIASSQLSSLLGCKHRFDRNAGGWIVAHGARMETDVPGVFVAGEIAGIGGMETARAEGRLAGLAAAASLGFSSRDREITEAQQASKRRRSFASLVSDLFPVRQRLYDEIGDDIVICRCEEVTAGEVRAACEPWIRDLNSVKAMTRCGMGRCQGRICGHHLSEIVARQTGRAPEELGHLGSRAPLTPVTAREIAHWGASTIDNAD